MKILVLGASGFIGNACFKYFKEKTNTYGLDRAGIPESNLLIDASEDVLTALLEQKFDVILNCAGASNIQDSFINTGSDFLLNVVFVQKILELIKTTTPETKMINISSAAVYGNPPSLPVYEDSPKNPLSPYGLHKLLSEKIMEEYAVHFGLKTLSVRIFSAYGVGLKRQFFFDLYQKMLQDRALVNLSGTGLESRDFIYISDIVKALEVLITKAHFDGGAYNLASEQESFIGEAAQMFSRICNYDGEIRFSQKQLEGYPLNWKANTGKINSLGFATHVDLESGLTLYYQWLKDNKR
jgi:dTDP-glucose 4,6-dehydratase/UDP-glucose 4-epimerase